QAGSIFHATSVLGTWLAALAGLVVGADWRYAYLLGIVPAALVLWVRAKIKEPEVPTARDTGSIRELWTDPRWRMRTLLGLGLAAVGLGTYWSVFQAGMD